jgi:short-subunit dehydrogenase
MESADESWIVLGASSPIARAFAREIGRKGSHLVLAGRDIDDLERTACDVRIATGASVEVCAFDAVDFATHAEAASRWAELPGSLNTIVLFGSMPQQSDIDADPSRMLECVAVTYAGAISILHHLAPHLEARKSGTVIGIGSVAGDRGRLKNYVYGSAKAGFHAYLSGLRNRLARSNVHVMTAKLGFVDTAMTWSAGPLFLIASPEAVAQRCLWAARKRRDVCYIPWFWRAIMGIIRFIPERIFKRLTI